MSETIALCASTAMTGLLTDGFGVRRIAVSLGVVMAGSTFALYAGAVTWPGVTTHGITAVILAPTSSDRTSSV